MPSTDPESSITNCHRLIVSYTDPVHSFIISSRTVEPTGSSLKVTIHNKGCQKVLNNHYQISPERSHTYSTSVENRIQLHITSTLVELVTHRQTTFERNQNCELLRLVWTVLETRKSETTINVIFSGEQNLCPAEEVLELVKTILETRTTESLLALEEARLHSVDSI